MCAINKMCALLKMKVGKHWLRKHGQKFRNFIGSSVRGYSHPIVALKLTRIHFWFLIVPTWLASVHKEASFPKRIEAFKAGRDRPTLFFFRISSYNGQISNCILSIKCLNGILLSKAQLLCSPDWAIQVSRQCLRRSSGAADKYVMKAAASIALTGSVSNSFFISDI